LELLFDWTLSRVPARDAASDEARDDARQRRAGANMVVQ